jgi:tetratricopeptide (TPR) repeat protein
VLLIKKVVEKSNPNAVNIIREMFLQNNHSSVIYPAINNGLSHHFADYKRPIPALLAKHDFKYTDIVDFFAKRDKKYQLTTNDKYLKSTISHVAYYYLSAKRFELAWPLYDLNEKESYVKYIIDRIAYEQLKNKGQALAAYKKAVELGSGQKDEALAEFEASLRRFKAEE